MGWFLIFFTVGTVLAVANAKGNVANDERVKSNYSYLNSYYLAERSFPYYFKSSMLGALIIAAGLALICMIIGSFAAPYADVTSERQLVAVADNSSISGEFFLGVGNINQTPVYEYYWQNNGYIERDSIDASYARIKEVQGEAKLVMRYKYKEGNLWWHFGTPRHNVENVFYVPAGSVTRSFNFDLER